MIIDESTARMVESYVNTVQTAHYLYTEITRRLKEIDDEVCITDFSYCYKEDIPGDADSNNDGSYTTQSGNCDYGYSGTVYIPTEIDNFFICVGYTC